MEIIREPKQQRAIEKKERIIKAGFDLICENGYHNINTAQIAKKSGVSTGIIYQYFNDKHDIFMEGLKKYGDNVFSPVIKIPKQKLNKENYEVIINNLINEYIKNHKLSKTAHEEIMAMVHSDKDVANYFYNREINITNNIKDYLLESGFKDNNLSEKVHISINIIDNLCHELIYHHHKEISYDDMTKIVIQTIKDIFKGDY